MEKDKAETDVDLWRSSQSRLQKQEPDTNPIRPFCVRTILLARGKTTHTCRIGFVSHARLFPSPTSFIILNHSLQLILSLAHYILSTHPRFPFVRLFCHCDIILMTQYWSQMMHLKGFRCPNQRAAYKRHVCYSLTITMQTAMLIHQNTD